MKCTLQFLTIAACLASAVVNAAKASADESVRAQYRWAKSPYGAMLERFCRDRGASKIARAALGGRAPWPLPNCVQCHLLAEPCDAQRGEVEKP